MEKSILLSKQLHLTADSRFGQVTCPLPNCSLRSQLRLSATDISKAAIKKAKCKERGFYLIEPLQDLTYLFDFKFDIIFSNKTLYYLSNEHLNLTLKMLNDLLRQSGIVFFTMMSTKHYFYSNFVKEIFDNGLSLVEKTGRVEGIYYINFTKDENELKRKMSIFEPLYIGYYDYCLVEGESRFHFMFTGKKRAL